MAFTVHFPDKEPHQCNDPSDKFEFLAGGILLLRYTHQPKDASKPTKRYTVHYGPGAWDRVVQAETIIGFQMQ